MTRLLRTLAILTATSTAYAGTSLPAQAARVVLDDPAGDTWSTASPAVPAGSARNTDLRRTVVAHGSTRVTVRARYGELVHPTRGETVSLAIRLRTETGAMRNAFVVARRATPRGQHTLVVERNGKPVPCPGLRHTINYSRNTVTLSLPRTCLQSPRWIRVMVVALDLRQEGTGTIDDAAGTGAEATRWTRRLRRG